MRKRCVSCDPSSENSLLVGESVGVAHQIKESKNNNNNNNIRREGGMKISVGLGKGE